MSISSPSIILYQGLRCTKVPRSSIAAATLPAVVPEPTPFLPTSVQGPEPVTTNLPSSTETADAVSLLSLTVVAPSDAQFGPLPTTSSLSEPPPHPESNRETHTSVPSPTSHNQTSGLSLTDGLSSTELSTTPSNSEVLTTPTAETGFMVETPTSNTVTAAFPSATNPLQNFSDHGSEDVHNHHTLRTILGSIFGTVGLIAIILLICFLIYRYRRRKPRDGRSFGGSEKLLRDGRHSADSWASSQHAFLSRTSSLSDAPSAPDHHVPGPNMGYAHVREGSSYLSQPNPNPSEVSLDMRPRIRDAIGGTQGQWTAGDKPFCPEASTLAGSHSPSYEKPISPGIQINQDQHSIYSSERSLGSTIILPGRSSFGSSVQRASYPISISDLGPPGPNDSVTRVSTRSDPFDLEVPPSAMHKRSSGTLPRGG
ncbi:hypothetical protein IFM58399_03750 [Aspergillus lentulus]|uniref:Uncharacterized protein n=1 Tax=Aspergillus lentulus TaxID=293939 RepID=A0AAN5YGP9_ASPLE|nr:uncharacterized protein IFM58399_03750 [Aspergillus lentulus]KAF4151393.1 hypothetical protein CNMCM6069_003985 [Aspergillus lentulus]KAF4159039.1 hypothetical protein CNMCM6936_004643 [Aspergillus lentulus]KAF4170763.1 hypothetical protein CNMCM8060_004380 [Aspergillus lentulus]KAF4176609.1 hypothetical protein CNMCM7927_003925 [Aspergillus lentulus]KAF4189240.1 hypothetical protein CNMCM8694_004246 [Aspergillus lentulus]